MSLTAHRLVEGQVALERVDEIQVGEGIAKVLLGYGGGQYPQELVIPIDPGQVTLSLLRPGVGVGTGGAILVLEVPGSHDLERLGAVEVHASRGLDIETGLGVEDRLWEGHVDASQGIDDVRKLVEVEGDRVLNGDTQVLLDRGHHLGRSLVQTGVDLIGTGTARIGYEEVPRYRQKGKLVSGRVGVEDHHDVAVHAVDPLGTEAIRRILDGKGAPRCRSDHQDVLRPGLGAGSEGGLKTVHLDPVQVVSDVIRIAARRAQEHEQGGEADENPPTNASAPPTSLGTSAIPSARLRSIDLLTERRQTGMIAPVLLVCRSATRPRRGGRRHVGFEGLQPSKLSG